MRVFTHEELLRGMIDHPYDTNSDLVAKVNFFHFSQDRRLAIAYYESPPGWFEVEVNGFEEIDYMLEGEVELISGSQKLTAQKGDCFLIQDGDKFRWQMKQASKMIFFIYPITRQIETLIASSFSRAGKPLP